MHVGGGGMDHGAAWPCLASQVPVPGRARDEVIVAQVQASHFDPNAVGLDQGWAFKAKGPPEPRVQAVNPGP